MDYSGSDSFTFTVDDGQDTSDPATVTVDVQGVVNLPPQAYPTSAETTENTPVVIDLNGLDPEGAALDFFADISRRRVDPSVLLRTSHAVLKVFVRHRSTTPHHLDTPVQTHLDS